MQFKRILLATDYSEISQRALRVATALAEGLDAELLIVHVAEFAEKSEAEAGSEDADAAELARVVPTDAGIRCRHKLLHFRPPGAAGVIVDAALEEGADLIVIGTHGRSGLRHFLAGSVAEDVVRKAHCPVVTVRRQDEEDEGAGDEAS